MTPRGSTTFRQVDPSAIDDDPFWSTVVREHPDLDLILLPPVAPPVAPAVPPAALAADPDEVVRSAVDALASAWSRLRPLAAAADPLEPDRPPSVRWGADRLLVQRALVGIGQEAGTDVLRGAAMALGTAGWLLRPSVRGDHPLIEARHGDTLFEGEAGPGATVLTLRSGPLVVHADHRAAARTSLVEAVRP